MDGERGSGQRRSADCRKNTKGGTLARKAASFESGERGETMQQRDVSRRTVLAGTTALSAATLLPGQTFGQASRAPTASLPTRKEFVVRGAHVLTMDEGLGDFARGDVHVRD